MEVRKPDLCTSKMRLAFDLGASRRVLFGSGLDEEMVV
jgi:hypothetical protein